MKLSDHVEHIRTLIDTAFRNRLGRMGVSAKKIQSLEEIPAQYHAERQRIETIRQVWIAETGSEAEAYEKLVEELTFTLFNRLSALKVMEAHGLHPEIVTRRPQHGDRSFAHLHWLEQHPDGRDEEMEGLVRFMEHQLSALAADIPLFSPRHPYHLLPTAIDLRNITNALNDVETDPQVERNLWQSDDVLGWLYESYNNYKKTAHKDSGDKTEFNKVSIQSQVYTPRWVVKFLVDNSVGKLYLEMYPDSDIKNKYKIANAPRTRTREPKPLTEIRVIDPATGSGNFLLYGFDLFYDLYTDQIDNYGADYDDRNIAELIIAHNLHGADLDDRAIQLAQFGLYIKAKRKKRSAKIEHFNIVSSDFYLPEYAAVKHLFESEQPLSAELERIVTDLWADLQQAYKFGTLIRLEEKFSLRLHGLVDREIKGVTLFSEHTLANYESFRQTFFANLQQAVTHNTAQQGQTFLNTKTQDAITFLELLTRKYDVALANPPYTDSSNFGPELKTFIDANYRQPLKFNSNLYATFIKRCYELIDEQGKMALIHPLTFMYIKTFEDVRKFILENTHISVLVDYSADSTNLFDGAFASAPAFYVLERGNASDKKSWFISLDQYTRTPNERFKKDFCLEALEDYVANRPNKHNISLSQEKLKIIEGWPFIYWISDGFREKFKGDSLADKFDIAQGIATAHNDKFLRYWWEIENNKENQKWYNYAKGGLYNKWFGNNWSVVNWESNGSEIRNIKDTNGKVRSRTQNERFYFREGITYSATSTKGVSFRYLPPNSLFDVKGSCIFLKKEDSTISINYTIALLNSKFVTYITDSLNATVETQVGDIKRVPFVKPPQLLEDNISALAAENVAIKKQLCTFSIIETNYENSPLLAYSDAALKDRVCAYLNVENAQLTHVLLNEAVINKCIFEVYDLSAEDREQVETKMGRPVGDLPVVEAARHAYMAEHSLGQDTVRQHLATLEAIEFDPERIQAITSEFTALYQSNNDLEEFCIRHGVNPVNVWYWFKESKVLPQARAAEIALEFLADAFRTILMEDDDGIVPLVGLPDEPSLLDRFEGYCVGKGFTSAQIMQLDSLLGRPVGEYVEQHFFKDLSDHLNLFMYLPKTPFIWHLTSGVHGGFEAYIIIYKWNGDSLYKIKSRYLGKRTESLHYRLQHLGDSNSGQAQTEKETIRLQLQEIETFARKIDDLIAAGYNPKLDDGVGKNIAPLQAKGMLKAEVLKSSGANSQLQKYLNADW